MSGEKCVECGISLTKKPRSEKVFSSGSYYCKKCYNKLPRSGNSDSCGKVTSVTLNIKSVGNCHSRCIFKCVNSAGQKLIRVPKNLRVFSLIKYRIIIYDGCRCCPEHIVDGDFDSTTISTFLENDLKNAVLSGEEVVKVIDELRSECVASISQENSSNNNFFDETEDLETWTGLNRLQFDELVGFLNAGDSNNDRLMLGAYLMHVYCGMPERKIAAFLTISLSTVSRLINSCREKLSNDFVSTHLANISREKIIRETTAISRTLHSIPANDDTVISVWDGTYVYLNKSDNFEFQRVTYSGHKKTNYLKPMLAVTTNGYIINVFGPGELWAGSQSDADILKCVMSCGWFKNFFKSGDLFVLDRGFQHVLSDLENKGFKVSIPSSKGGTSQLSTAEANESRICTKVRWVVEAVNSSLKRFKHLQNTVNSYEVPSLYNDVRIISAMHNCFFSRRVSDLDDVNVAISMLQQVDKPNLVQKIVQEEGLVRKSLNFERLNHEHFDHLPVWSSKDIYSLSGSYQLRLSKSYISNHFADGKYEFSVTKDASLPDFHKYGITLRSPFFLKAKLSSRHVSQKVYSIFVLIDTAEMSSSAVVGQYCTCKNGARTVGACAHVISIIWFLFYGRHKPSLATPAGFLNKSFPLRKKDFDTSQSQDESGDSDDEPF